MLNWYYVEAWLYAFIATQLVETPLYRALAPTTWWRAFALSLVTHPMIWFVWPPLAERLGVTHGAYLVFAELFAWLVEAALLLRWRVSARRAVLVAFINNSASVAVGATLRWLTLMP